MRAVTKLEVPARARLNINVTMTVEEAETLLQLLSDLTRWPMAGFKEVLRGSLKAALAAYEAEVKTGDHDGD